MGIKAKIYRPFNFAPGASASVVDIQIQALNDEMLLNVITSAAQFTELDIKVQNRTTGAFSNLVTLSSNMRVSQFVYKYKVNFGDYIVWYRGRIKGTDIQTEWRFYDGLPSTLIIETIGALMREDGGIEVQWTTNAPSDSYVEYWLQGFPDDKSAMESSAKVNVHKMILQMLSVNSTYYFRVRSRNANASVWSLTYKFQTVSELTLDYDMSTELIIELEAVDFSNKLMELPNTLNFVITPDDAINSDKTLEYITQAEIGAQSLDMEENTVELTMPATEITFGIT